MDQTHLEGHDRIHAVVAFKDVTAPTNVRTMIAALVPYGPFGNTLPCLIPEIEDQNFVSLMLANFNCLAFDFLARQRCKASI